MGRAKEIIVKVIPSKIANEFVKNNHYSGKVVPNSTLHFGGFLDNKLHGEYKRFHSNGQIIVQTTYVGNNYHGEYKEWLPTGELITQMNFVDGVEEQ